MDIVFCPKNVSSFHPSDTLCRNFSNSDEILFAKIGPRRRSMPIIVILFLIYSLIFISGVIGNVFTCIVIIRTSYMRTSTNYYLFSLAISDVILLIIGLPPEAYSIWESYPWRFGKAFCIIKALFAEMTSYASVLTITAFTIERYIAICKPLKSHKIVAFSRCIKIIIGIWIISLCCALPYPIHTDLFYYVHDDTGKPIQDSLQCNIPPKYDERMAHVFQLSTFFFFVFPLTVIVVLYSLIGCTLRKAELRREPSHKRRSGNCRYNSQGQHERSPTFIARRSVLKVLVAVVVAFFVCWAPFHAQRLLTVYNRHWTPLMFDVQSSLFYVSGVLYFVGSTVNPILYNVMSKRYRLAFLETICHSKNRHSYSSHRQTNGGTSLKRKHSSLKGSVRRGHKGINKAEEQENHHENKEAFIYQKCHHYGVDGNISKRDVCEANNECIPLDGIARVRSYKGGFNHQEFIQAEKKHASKCATCAKGNHEGDYVQLQCTNLADIPPLCLADDYSSNCNGKSPCAEKCPGKNEKSNSGGNSCETNKLVANGLALGHFCENSDKLQTVTAHTNKTCVDNGHVSYNHNKCMNTDAVGEFV